MLITLLTHERETAKPTNTGALVQEVLRAQPNAQCERVMWQRTAPDERLLQRLIDWPSALVYPNAQTGDSDGPTPTHFVLIDSTWQQARKMLNHSPYLQRLPRIDIHRERPSRYNLRRNQVPGGLCTSECAAELLRQHGQSELAHHLDEALEKKLS